MKRIIGMMLGLMVANAGSAAWAEPSTSSLPDLGVVINLDGDDAYTKDTLPDSESALRSEIDRYAQAGLGTIVYSLGAGSEVMLYPTQVADTWGWRPTPYDDDPKWSERIKRNRANQEVGGDAIRVAGEQAKKNGLLFVPSLRMNDAHYAFGKPPRDYPLAGSFYVNHPEFVLGDSPIKSKAEYGQLLDFSHAEVRQHRLDQIVEATKRYQDVMDGFELDFTRFQVFFPTGTTDERAPLMTELVRQTRLQLDTLGEANGKRYFLIVRIPPTPESCAWSGLDVEAWAREGLVDVLVPSLMMTTGFEMPVDSFKAMGGGEKVAVYPSLLPRVGWRWPALDGEYVDPTEGPRRDLSLAQLRGAALNQLTLGADGLYLFNFQHYPLWRGHPSDGPGAQAIRQLGDADTMRLQDLVFAVTKAYWQDHEGTYENRKQLPVTLHAGDSLAIELMVGVNPATLNGDTALTLRLGLRDVGVDQAVTVELNGQLILQGDLATTSVSVPGPAKQADLAQRLLEVRVNPAVLTKGRNGVSVTLNGGAALLTDVELLVDRP